MTTDDYAHEVRQRMLEALSDLWSATDHREATELDGYTDRELKEFLGRWVHVRRACNAFFQKIRDTRPDLPGWDPISEEKPVEERLQEERAREAEPPSA